MSFFDNIKETANKIKDENKNFGQTIQRMNNQKAYLGTVNRGLKGGDFWEGSYINLEKEKGLIYSSAQDDYTFGKEDIASLQADGDGGLIAVGGTKLPSMRFLLTFSDGKTACVEILMRRVPDFLAVFKK